MAGETKPKEEPKEEPKVDPKTGEEISKEAIRNHPFFHEVTGKQKAEIDKIKAEHEALKASIAKGEEDKRKAALEAAGNYKQLIAERDAEKADLLASHQAELLRRDLRDALRSEKVESKVFLDWAVSGYQGKPDEIKTYIEQLKANPEHEMFFNSQSQDPAKDGQPGTPRLKPGSGSSLNLADRLKSSDPEVKRAALKEQFQKALNP